MRAQVVLGGGGYVAAPVGLAAEAMRVPLALTDADSHLAGTNRMLARFARHVFLAFPIDGGRGQPSEVAGRPVPAATTGGDGSVAGPVGRAAVAMRVPLVLPEPYSPLGVTNRMLARFARPVFLPSPIDGRTAPPYEVVGRPVPAATTGADRAEARRRFAI